MSVVGDLLAATPIRIATACGRMKSTRVSILDAWFEHTILNELPETRIQEFMDNDGTVVRLVRPTLDAVR